MLSNQYLDHVFIAENVLNTTQYYWIEFKSNTLWNGVMYKS